MAKARDPSLSARPDDARGYRQGGVPSSGRNAPAAGRTGSGRRGSGGSKSSSVGLNMLLAIMVAGLGVAGWFLFNQHKMLQTEQSARQDAESRLVVLEDRLRVTDEAMTETGQDTQNKIGLWETEIRKLWAVSNERNKGWIETNQTTIGKHASSLKNLASGQQQVKGQVAKHQTAFEQQQGILDQLTAIDINLQQLQKNQRDMVDKVNEASQKVASLQSSLVKRVAENEQAVKAIDAYRLQLNSRLAGLEKQLSQLSGPAL